METKPYRRIANYYETDAMGIIHHSNYIRWFEEARVDFMEQLGFGYHRSVQEGVDIAVLEVECAYRSMVRFGDTVDIYVTISHMTPVRMTVSYQIKDAKTGELRTTGQTMHCFLDSVSHMPVRLNKRIPELYDIFLSMLTEENQ